MRRNALFTLPALAALTLGGCIIQQPGTMPDDTGAPSNGDGDGGNGQQPPGETFTLEGKVNNLLTSDATGEGLCVTVLDPAPAFDAGGDMKVMARARVDSSNSYHIENVPLMTQGLGMLVMLDDCAEAVQDCVLPAASHIPQRQVNNIMDGERIANFNLYVIDHTAQDLIQEGLEGAGYDGNWTSEGVLMGYVLDDDAQPVEGAKVPVEEPYQAFYLSQDLAFGTEGTNAQEGALWAIPGAPLDWYTAQLDDQEFDDHYIGSLPGMAIIISLNELQ